MKQYGTFPVLHRVHIKGATVSDRLTGDDKAELAKKFAKWGEVVFIQIHMKSRNKFDDKDLERPYGFVTFREKDSVIACLQDSAVGVSLDDGRLIFARQAVFNLKQYSSKHNQRSPRKPTPTKTTDDDDQETTTPMVSEAEDDEPIRNDEDEMKEDSTDCPSENDLEMQLLSDISHD